MAPMQQPQRPRWHGPQRRIGLTGGIASGKSSVGRLLAARGVPVLDADQYARDTLAPGTPGAQTVLQRYGERISTETADTINRAALGEIVFNNPTERQWLERLVHPMVRARFKRELQKHRMAPVVALMIPLLFETKLENICSEVWLVDCTEKLQEQRLQHRDSLSQEQARARIAAQWPLARKRKLADVVINNRNKPEDLIEQVDQALRPASNQP